MVYVNPRLRRDDSINTRRSTLAGSRTSAWNNTSALYLQNFADENGSDNANWVIGTNYIYVLVTNTNSITGSSGSTALNPSGLLVYQVGALATIDGSPIPEVGTVLPIIFALGLLVGGFGLAGSGTKRCRHRLVSAQSARTELIKSTSRKVNVAVAMPAIIGGPPLSVGPSSG